MRQAIRNVSKELGPEAVIISNAKTADGIEIVAAVDYDETLFQVSIAAPAADQVSGEEAGDQAVPNDTTPGKNTKETDNVAGINIPSASNHSSGKQAEAGVHASTASSSPAMAAKSGPQNKTAMRRPHTGVITPVALKDLKSELGELRNMMESQLEGLAFGEQARLHPLRNKLIRYLVSYGFDVDLCRKEAEKIDDSWGFVKAWRAILQGLGKTVPIAKQDLLEKGGVVCLLGPTGVGKTTTIAKLAARYSLKYGSKNIALITTDNYRIGAHEQLRTYARILGIAVYGTRHASALADTVAMMPDKKLILVDTAGVSQRDERLQQQLEMLREAVPNAAKYLVLSAATQARSYAQVIKAYQSEKLAGCIFTKLDESVNLGGALSAAIKFKLPISHISNGQRVPEDLAPAVAAALVKQAVTVAQRIPGAAREEVPETTSRGNAVNANV